MTTFTYDESAISRVNTGIRIGVYPSSDASASIELERATAGSSSSFLRIASMSAFAGQVQASMDDRLPADGVRRFYRARSVRGDAASTYTRTVSAKPATLLMNTVMTPPLSGTPIGVDGWISSGVTWKVGRPGAAGSIAKRLRVPFTAMMPKTSATVFRSSRAWITGGPSTFYAEILLPPGVTMTGVQMRNWGNSVVDVIGARLLRVGTTGNTVSLSTLVQTGGHGWNTISMSVTESVTSSKAYVVEVALNSSQMRLGWYDITYTAPTYRHVY